MFYTANSTNFEKVANRYSYHLDNQSDISRVIENSNRAHKRLLEQKLAWQQLLKKQEAGTKTKKPVFKSKNSIWDTVKLLERFKKPGYQSRASRVDLLKADALHHAKEMALIEPITRYSYWHTVANNETLGDGYSEDMGLMLNSFTQDLVKKGMGASRATIETITFEKARQELTQIALKKNHDEAILITSFPDDTEAGYHGVDSKHNWDRSETHHSFFYLLQVGVVIFNDNGTIKQFEIKTTQYRAWPNVRQALEIQKQLGSPITTFDAPIPNLLFANLIHLNQEQLAYLASKFRINGPKDNLENEIEKTFKSILYADSEKHVIKHTQLPKVDQETFWVVQEQYFTDFYLAIALPIFDEISQIQNLNQEIDIKTQKKIQEKIDYLDKAFFYYSKILLGWIKINNTSPEYTEAFKEKNQLKKLLNFQQKLLLRLLGQKQTLTIPTVDDLKIVLDIDQRIATRQFVSSVEKKKLLNIWGFFSFVGNFGSLLQCGALAPFTLPISIMNKSFNAGSSIAEFSGSITSISLPEKQQLLTSLQKEEYVELDLTKQKPYAAKKIYTVPKSYLEGPGCNVNETGNVLGPCFETKLVNGKEIKTRIPLDDPRDILAFPMTLFEFNQYMKTLQKSIEHTALSEIDTLFQSKDFSIQDKRKARIAIKKLRQKLIKKSLNLQDFISGDLTINQFNSDNEWLKSLVIMLSFSLNPVETLVQEVESKQRENNQQFYELVEQLV